jgi:hypothetical protein
MPYNVNFKTGKLEAINETNGDKNNLEVGRVLHLNGYNDPDFIITANRGIDPKWTSYGAMYDTVSLLTGEMSRHQAYTLAWLKDKKDGRIQTYITDRIMDREEMAWALIAAAATKAENDRTKKEADEKEAKELAALPALFPYLKQGSGVVEGAANMRIELKRTFPGVKFSVKSEHRGSSSIDIGWTDGPSVEQVKEITDKYQQGNFNGMEDIYEYNRAVWPEVFGGARYVFENRHISPELTLKAAKELGYDLVSGECDNYGNLPGLDSDNSQMVYRKARQMTAYIAPTVTDSGKVDREMRRQIRLNKAAETNFRNCKRDGKAMYY